MAHRALSVCLSLLFSAQLLLAQQEDESWLSLSRLTITATGSYHYAPWKKYNESLQLVQDAIRYNPAYSNPRGSLDLVKGDLTGQIEASYRVFGSFSLLVSAGWMHTEGVIDFSTPLPSSTPPGNTSYFQAMWLSSFHYGVGIAYTHAVDEDLSFSVGASIVRFPVNLDFQASYQLDGPVDFYVPPMYSSLFKANLRQTALGFNTHVEAKLKIGGPLSIVSRLEYRWLTLKHLQGSGSESDIYASPNSTQVYGPRAFEAQLGESDGYFGLFIPPLNINDYYLHSLWSRTPSKSWYDTQRPTSLDISGVGISLGVSYAF